MSSKLTRLLTCAASLALFSTVANAALVLSGYTAGSFEGSSSGNTTITNSSDGRAASIRTGIPVGGSFQSGIYFTGINFANITDGDVFSIGMIRYENGINLLGTSSAAAAFDFRIHLNDPVVDTLPLTTFHFAINATHNEPGLVPDQFSATFSQPSPVVIDGTRVTFIISDLMGSRWVPEDGVETLANVRVEMTPVPELGTYGLMATLGLLALVGYRRMRLRVSSQITA